MRIRWTVLGLMLCLLIGFGVYIIANNINASPQALSSLLHLTDCSMTPCLFGVSIEGATHAEVEEMLLTSPLTIDAEYDFSEGNIRWFWPGTIAEQLNVAAYPVLEENIIIFNDDVVYQINLAIAIKLEDLIAQFGTPQMIQPYTYTRFGDMDFLVTFENIQGSFKARTRCDKPTLAPDTIVLEHISHQMFASMPVIEWEGYNTDLPRCSVFQP